MDSTAFRKLALDEIDAVYRLAYHLAPRPDLADDFVQETYLRAFRAERNFQLTEAGVRPYLFKILHNLIYSAATRQARQPGPLDEEREFVDQRPPPDLSLDDRGQLLQWDGIDERLKHAIGALPLAQRTVFLLCAIEDLRYREIADVVGVPLGTVMSRMHHARQSLLQHLKGFDAEQHHVGVKVQPDKLD